MIIVSFLDSDINATNMIENISICCRYEKSEYVIS